MSREQEVFMDEEERQQEHTVNVKRHVSANVYSTISSHFSIKSNFIPYFVHIKELCIKSTIILNILRDCTFTEGISYLPFQEKKIGTYPRNKKKDSLPSLAQLVIEKTLTFLKRAESTVPSNSRPQISPSSHYNSTFFTRRER